MKVNGETFMMLASGALDSGGNSVSSEVAVSPIVLFTVSSDHGCGPFREAIHRSLF
jgi:hypothetical protein